MLIIILPNIKQHLGLLITAIESKDGENVVLHFHNNEEEW